MAGLRVTLTGGRVPKTDKKERLVCSYKDTGGSGCKDSYPGFRQEADTFLYQVRCRVPVPVMDGAAVRAGPLQDGQVLYGRFLMPAYRAGLGGGIPPGDFQEAFSCILLAWFLLILQTMTTHFGITVFTPKKYYPICCCYEKEKKLVRNTGAKCSVYYGRYTKKRTFFAPKERIVFL